MKVVVLLCALCTAAAAAPVSVRAVVVEGGGVPRAAIAADGTAYVSTASRVTAYRPDGAVAWRLDGPLFVDAILPLRDGEVAIAGWFIEPLALGGKVYPATDTNQQFVVARLSSTGRVRWANVAYGGLQGGMGMPRDSSIDSYAPLPHGYLAEAPDGDLVVLGSVTQSGGGHVIVRHGRDGREKWRQRFAWGDLAIAARGIAVDARGDVFLAGTLSRPTKLGTFELDPGSYPRGDLVAARLDGATGRWLWARSFGSADDDRATAIAVLPDGKVLVAGQLGKPAALGCVAQLGTASRAFVIALAPGDGACAWWRSYPIEGGGVYPRAYFDAIAVDARGLVATGYLPVAKDAPDGRILAGLSPAGELAWSIPVDLQVHHVALGDGAIRLVGVPVDKRTILGKRLDGERRGIAIVELR